MKLINCFPVDSEGSDWTWETCSESEEDETGSTGMYLSQLLHVRFCRPAKIYFVYIIINFMQKKFLFTFLQQQLPQQIQLLHKEHLQLSQLQQVIMSTQPRV